MFSFNIWFALIAILLIFITYFFIFRSGNKNSKYSMYTRPYQNKSDLFGEDRFNEPSTNVLYRDIPEVSFNDEKDIIGEENREIDDDTTFLGGLYRRKPKRYRKKKQSLNKNKYKKHRKPRK